MLMVRATRRVATPGAAARPARGRRDARRGDGWICGRRAERAGLRPGEL